MGGGKESERIKKRPRDQGKEIIKTQIQRNGGGKEKEPNHEISLLLWKRKVFVVFVRFFPPFPLRERP